MKKLIAIFTALVMSATMCCVAYAANGGFISSPSGNEPPVLIEGKNESEDCESIVVITPYAEKAELDNVSKALIEDAYKQIAANGDLTKLCAELSDAAAKLNLTSADLAVSDLFDISYTNCDESVHQNHGAFRIKLSAETLKKFVGLLHFHDGKWELVENATVDEAEQVLTFKVDSLSPFAVVVNAEAAQVPPTGDVALIAIYAAIMAASGIALAVLWGKSRKSAK